MFSQRRTNVPVSWFLPVSCRQEHRFGEQVNSATDLSYPQPDQGGSDSPGWERGRTEGCAFEKSWVLGLSVQIYKMGGGGMELQKRHLLPTPLGDTARLLLFCLSHPLLYSLAPRLMLGSARLASLFRPPFFPAGLQSRPSLFLPFPPLAGAEQTAGGSSGLTASRASSQPLGKGGGAVHWLLPRLLSRGCSSR